MEGEGALAAGGKFCRVAASRLPGLDDVDAVGTADVVLEEAVVEVLKPGVLPGRLDFEGRVDNVLVPDAFPIDPGEGVVELEHVDALLHDVDAVLEGPRFLLLGEEQGLAGLAAGHLPQVVEAYVDVLACHHHAVVEDGVLLQHLKVPSDRPPPLDEDVLADPDCVVGGSQLLGVPDGRLLGDGLDDYLQEGRVAGQEVGELQLAQLVDDLHEEGELVGKAPPHLVCQLVEGVHEYLGGAELPVEVEDVVVAHGDQHQHLELRPAHVQLDHQQHHCLQQHPQLLQPSQIVLHAFVHKQALEALVLIPHAARQTSFLQDQIQQGLRNAAAHEGQQV